MRDITPTFAGSEEKTWLTPPHIINALGHFDLDPCVPDSMPWKTADRMVMKAEDGLTVDWNGKRVWLNPPYGLPSIPFLQKMAAHEGGGIALLFSRTDTSYFHDIICTAAHSLFFFRGRLKFVSKTGDTGHTCPYASMLISYSEADTEIINKSGLNGITVKL